MRLRSLVLLPALVVGLAHAPLGAQDRPGTKDDPASRPGPLTEDEKILHLLNRFTPGATPELVAEVKAAGWRAWFEDQLRGDRPEPEAYTRRVEALDTITMTTAEIADKYIKPLAQAKTEREKREARRLQNVPARQVLEWIGIRAAFSANPVREASADFFRNHFSVSIDKNEVRFLVVDWERDVIRKHALGNFGDFLEATAKSPAMLFYLDNHLSRRPATPEELRIIEERTKRRTGSEERAEEEVDLARQRGLNENYARELLELHTLGVDNFYTQDDVIEVAKCLTGWTIGRIGRVRGTFDFNRLMHCPGDKKFLGGTIQENRADPVREGEQVLETLKKHEGTARFLAWKLCRWFVNDQPDDAMVARIAKVFTSTGGNIPKVYLAIVDDPGFFTRENYRAKFKRPWEFVVSALRATGAEVSDASAVGQQLNAMNEPLYRCGDPTGYYDQAEAWCDPGAMAVRWTFATELAAGRIRGARLPSSIYADLPADRPKEWKDRLAARLLPVVGLSAATSANIDRIVEAELKSARKPGPTTVGPLIVAAILGSPDFQRQ